MKDRTRYDSYQRVELDDTRCGKPSTVEIQRKRMLILSELWDTQNDFSGSLVIVRLVFTKYHTVFIRVLYSWFSNLSK